MCSSDLARVHNGYHYPRSILTGYRSAVNFPRFTKQFGAAIHSDFNKYYAVAKHLSKVNAHQFKNFADKIEADIAVAPPNIQKMFNKNLIEEVFKVKEYAFNAHALRDDLLRQINDRPGITLHTGCRVTRIDETPDGLCVVTDGGEFRGDFVLNCTYANINTLHRASNIPLVGLKHEVTEMCLVSLPEHRIRSPNTNYGSPSGPVSVTKTSSNSTGPYNDTTTSSSTSPPPPSLATTTSPASLATSEPTAPPWHSPSS